MGSIISVSCCGYDVIGAVRHSDNEGRGNVVLSGATSGTAARTAGTLGTGAASAEEVTAIVDKDLHPIAPPNNDAKPILKVKADDRHVGAQDDNDVTYLDKIEYKDTTTFVYPIRFGKVIKVYDGDTITIAARLPHSRPGNDTIFRFSVRLNGIDSPEIRGKSATEKDLAKHARDALHDLIFGKIVELKEVGNEKYGRILADVYLGKVNVNQWMVTKKFAVEYDGGTKMRPDNWD